MDRRASRLDSLPSPPNFYPDLALGRWEKSHTDHGQSVEKKILFSLRDRCLIRQTSTWISMDGFKQKYAATLFTWWSKISFALPLFYHITAWTK